MDSSGKIRVLIVDDVAASRDNIAKLLRFEADVEVVGLAAGGQTGIDLALSLEPDVVLMDMNMPGVDGIAATTRISGRLPNTAVIMMSVQNESDYLRRAMLAGAREFLAKPFGLEELIGSIRHVHQLAQANRRVPVEQLTASPIVSGRGERGRVIVLFGLKGGVGRTTLAINLAIGLRQQADRDVALLDGNLLYGDVGVMLNLNNNKTISDVVRQFDTMDRDLISEVLVTHSSGVKVLLAPPDPQAGEQVTAHHVRQVMQHLTSLVGHVVVDTRPSFDEATIALLDMADVIVLVLTLELTAIKGAKQYLELTDLLGYDADKILLVINRASAVAGIPVEDVATSLKGKITATLPEDAPLALRAINEGVPFLQSAPQAPLSQSVLALARQIAGTGGIEEMASPVTAGRHGSGRTRFGRFSLPMGRRRG